MENISPNQYVISFYCPNCGTTFQKVLQKGSVALGRGGECPNCGVKDGQSGVGNFEVIKKERDPKPFRDFNKGIVYCNE